MYKVNAVNLIIFHKNQINFISSKAADSDNPISMSPITEDSQAERLYIPKNHHSFRKQLSLFQVLFRRF